MCLLCFLSDNSSCGGMNISETMTVTPVASSVSHVADKIWLVPGVGKQSLDSAPHIVP